MNRIKLILTITTAFFYHFSSGSYWETLSIVEFGAVPDGITLNTKAIQQAIDESSENGGGRVHIPPGKFLTGCIELKSNVELHLEAGAVLLGSTSLYDYFRSSGDLQANSPKTDDNSDLGLILAVKAENIKLTGHDPAKPERSSRPFRFSITTNDNNTQSERS